MTSYSGRHAQYYDIFYQGKGYAEEAAFINESLSRYGISEGSRILELACGTGNHAFELEKLGYELLATDYSEDVLRQAKRKAKSTKSKVEFRLADMRELALDEVPFDAAICLFDSIGYAQSDEAVGVVLQNVHRHLRPEGIFIFEVWHSLAMLNHYDPLRVRRWPIPGGELLRISTTTLDEAQNLAEVNYDIFELRDDQSYARLQETQVNRFFSVEEMAALLLENQFQALAWLNGYTWDENIDDKCWHILAIARRA